MISINKKQWIAQPSDQEGVEKFHDGKGTQLVINSIGFDEDLYPIINNLGEVRKYYRDSFAQQGVGIIECDVTTTNGHPCVKVLGKRIVQGEAGLYIGSLAIPMSDKSFVVSLYAQEAGVTGVRDAGVLAVLMAKGETFDADPESGKMLGWAQDPYFPDFDGPSLKNKSEDRDYDSQFADHPLTKVRTYLDVLPKEISMKDTAKPWWKVW